MQRAIDLLRVHAASRLNCTCVGLATGMVILTFGRQQRKEEGNQLPVPRDSQSFVYSIRFIAWRARIGDSAWLCLTCYKACACVHTDRRRGADLPCTRCLHSHTQADTCFHTRGLFQLVCHTGTVPVTSMVNTGKQTVTNSIDYGVLFPVWSGSPGLSSSLAPALPRRSQQQTLIHDPLGPASHNRRPSSGGYRTTRGITQRVITALLLWTTAIFPCGGPAGAWARRTAQADWRRRVGNCMQRWGLWAALGLPQVDAAHCSPHSQSEWTPWPAPLQTASYGPWWRVRCDAQRPLGCG